MLIGYRCLLMHFMKFPVLGFELVYFTCQSFNYNNMQSNTQYMCMTCAVAESRMMENDLEEQNARPIKQDVHSMH